MKPKNPYLPQHRQLSNLLRDHIGKGVYQPGDLLPSEHALCQTYQLTRPTVRQALQSLQVEGLIKKQRGKGSIVQPKKPGIGILSIGGTTDSLPAGALQTRVIDSPTVMPWVEETEFDPTDTERESGVVRLSRLRLIEESPILYEVTLLPNINLPRFCQRNLENKSLFGILRAHYDLYVTGGEQKIAATTATDAIRTFLDVEPDQPVLHLQKKYETNRPDYHFYTAIWARTDQYVLQGPI